MPRFSVSALVLLSFALESASSLPADLPLVSAASSANLIRYRIALRTSVGSDDMHEPKGEPMAQLSESLDLSNTGTTLCGVQGITNTVMP